ncbi:MAG: ankyrin repeat domain-containing protein, partial [Arcobacteraceae bacterium]|nr:ankyrin repeat domain-containing protein [Arcobacteraceae bacterium]
MKNYLVFILLTLLTTGCLNQNNLNNKDNNETQTNSIDYTTKARVVNKDFKIENALHDAVRASDLELVEFLVEQKINYNLQDQYGYTPLHLAVRLHNYDITKYLIYQGANLNTIDTYKDTPLLDSTRNNDTNISEILICNGAKRDVIDIHQMSTLNNSSKNKNRYISKLLRADKLEPYCQKELEIIINDKNKNKICGDITKGFAVTLEVTLKDKDENSYGPYDATIDNEEHKWCIDTTDKDLAYGFYTVDAQAKDYVVNTADATLDPYLYAEVLTINIDDINETNKTNPTICGISNSDNLKTLKVSLKDENNNSYGYFNAKINNTNKTWCANVDDNLTDGNYTITAYGIDSYEQNGSDKHYPYLVALPIEVISQLTAPQISIITTSTINDNTPKICGLIDEGRITNIDLNLTDENNKTFGTYNTIVNNDNSWCVDVTDELENGKYNIVAWGIDENNQTAIDNNSTNIYVILGLYEALMVEFKDDFKDWDAVLEKDTLVFRFQNPTVLFKTGSRDMKNRFKNIIENFFPRYNKILAIYKNEISSVSIEGHASSEHKLGKTTEEKYNLNLILSQSRADEVLIYSKNLEDIIIVENKFWIEKHFRADGRSSS